MKNIVFWVNNLGKGGAQRVTSVLANRLIKDNNVTVVYRDSDSCVYDIDPKIKTVFIKDYQNNHTPNFAQKKENIIFRIKRRFLKGKELKKLNKLYYFYQVPASWFKRYLDENPCDVIYSFMVGPNINLTMVKTNAKTILSERNYPAVPLLETDPVEVRNKYYPKGDIIVFQTEEMKNMFSPEVVKKSVVIPNPIKENLPLPFEGERQKIIANYCSLDRPQKNLQYLFKAFDMVAEKYPDYKLVVYGYGELNPVAREALETAKNKEKITVLPFDPNLHEKIKDYAMFVMTSDFEGMPNSLIEAMGIGLPVISTDCKGGGAKALINNHKNGIIVPRDDINAVADAIEFYIENPEKAKEYAKEALKVREELSVDKIAEKWLALI